jgi:aspartyl-tRNA synthetase
LEGIYEHLINNNFIQVFTPSILDKGNDGGADVFKFKYFDKNAYLRQNPQLHKQLTILGGFEKIFEIGHEWRADPSKTARHISEHVDITVEEAYVNDIEDLMDFEEDLIIAGIRKVLEKGDKDLKTLKKVVEIPKKPFPRIACAELDNLLRDSAEIISEDRLSITGKARLMNSKIREKYGSKFYFLTDYPFSDVPFYSMRDEENNSITKNTYLICDGVGICSSGLREHRYKNLLRNIEDKGTKDTEWYTKFFEYGAPPHGGFSLGLERFTMQLLGLENIREASLYPRDANSIYL